MQLSDDAKKKITGAMNEISSSMLRTEAEKDLQKNIINDLFDEHKIPKKVLAKMARVYHKQNFAEEKATHEEFEELYHTITGTNND